VAGCFWSHYDYPFRNFFDPEVISAVKRCRRQFCIQFEEIQIAYAFEYKRDKVLKVPVLFLMKKNHNGNYFVVREYKFSISGLFSRFFLEEQALYFINFLQNSSIK
jgi:hypothetical protein